MSERRGLRDLVTLEGRALTLALWTSVALMSASWWVTPLPPLIDYPQHVAIGAILRRMVDPASPERSTYEVGLVTYNGGFHLAIAALSFVVRPEVAGKILLSTFAPLLALAQLALVRAAGRPRWYALLGVPATFSFVVGWGFANYFLSMPLAMLAFTWWLRGVRGERGMLWRVWAASAVLAYTHVFATLLLCTAIGTASLALIPSLGDTWTRRVSRLVRQPLAVLPAIVWCVAVFIHNRQSPHANWEGWDDGLDDPLWYKLAHLTAYTVGNFGDWSDQKLFAAAVAVAILLWTAKERTGPGEPLFRTLALVFAALYCVIPKVFIASWFMFERLPPWFVAFGVAAVPEVPEAATRTLRTVAASLALAAGVNTVWHMARIPDEADATAILDDIPSGARVVAVTWSNQGMPIIQREMWVHHLAYHQARRPALIGYSFAKFESMPVHYRLDRVPPVVQGGLEWDARKYDWDTTWGRYWTTVLVRTPDDAPGMDPRLATFGDVAGDVNVISHRGRFWLLDASALAKRPAAAPAVAGDRER